MVGTSERAVQKWISAYELHGLKGILPAKRISTGNVTISRAWDNAVCHHMTEHDQMECLRMLRDHIRALYKAGTARKMVRFMAGIELISYTKMRGFKLPDHDAMQAICRVPERLLDAELHYRKLRRRSHDRKRDEDDKPRIHRTRFNMEPMQVLTLDMHPMDHLIETADGNPKTPHCLAFMDVGTGRVFCEILFFEGRGGVRNVDLITAMVNLLKHPAWGWPKVIYVDNGTEYGFVDHLCDLVMLGIDVRDRNEVGIKHALPYNAAAKLVELFFSHFEQLLAISPSHIGGNRMAPKRPALGKTHSGFAGGIEAFRELFYSVLRLRTH